MRTFISNKNAFDELKKTVEDFIATGGRLACVVIRYPREDFEVREARLTESAIVFLGFPDATGKYRAEQFDSGESFLAFVDCSSSGDEICKTKFVDQTR